jgi:hypothetical protein
LLLTLATADGFQVAFGIPAEACRGLGLTCRDRLAAGEADDDETEAAPIRLN